MPSEFAGGSVKLAAFRGTCKSAEVVLDGNCPAGRNMLSPISHRNGRYAVGVPVQNCAGCPWALQPTVYGVPAKMEPFPFRYQPSSTALVKPLFQSLLPP